MAQKPKTKTGAPKRRSGNDTKAASARKKSGSSSTRKAAPAKSSEKEAPRSRFAAIVTSPTVRNILAATLVSAAGALLYNKGGRDRDDDEQSGDDRSGYEPEAAAKPTVARRAKAAVAGVKSGTSRGRKKVQEVASAAAGALRVSNTGKPDEQTTAAPKVKSPPKGIEMPTAGLSDTEASAFAFAAPEQPAADIDVSTGGTPAAAEKS